MTCRILSHAKQFNILISRNKILQQHNKIYFPTVWLKHWVVNEHEAKRLGLKHLKTKNEDKWDFWAQPCFHSLMATALYCCWHCVNFFVDDSHHFSSCQNYDWPLFCLLQVCFCRSATDLFDCVRPLTSRMEDSSGLSGQHCWVPGN